MERQEVKPVATAIATNDKQPNTATFQERDLSFRQFSCEKELQWMIDTIGAELAEPYSIFTYNYFISQFPKLTIMAYHCDRIIGCIIGKCENKKAYIAMLVVDRQYRRHHIGKKLFDEFYRLVEPEADKIVLETECINTAALRFYEKVGFIRTRRMLNYYMSGNDAFRLKLFIR